MNRPLTTTFLMLGLALGQQAAAQSATTTGEGSDVAAAAGNVTNEATAEVATDGTPLRDTDAPVEEEPMILSAEDVSLEDFLWVKRPVIVFADSAADPRYIEQMSLITARLEDLRERDVVVITDTDPDNLSSVRKKLRPRGFMLALIGKDGTVYLRKPFPWDVRELSRSIDKMPMRQQEIRDRRQNLLE